LITGRVLRHGCTWLIIFDRGRKLRKGCLPEEERLSGERVERRLAAILAADVVGYSRLVGVDEEGTLERLRVLRREVVDPMIKEHRGRIVRVSINGSMRDEPSAVSCGCISG